MTTMSNHREEHYARNARKGFDFSFNWCRIVVFALAIIFISPLLSFNLMNANLGGGSFTASATSTDNQTGTVDTNDTSISNITNVANATGNATGADILASIPLPESSSTQLDAPGSGLPEINNYLEEARNAVLSNNTELAVINIDLAQASLKTLLLSENATSAVPDVEYNVTG